MRQLDRYCRLSAAERALLARAALTVAAIRLGLCVLPFARLRRLVARATKSRAAGSASQPIERLAWAVMLTSRYVPKATCLTQALALQVLLGRQGQAAQLQFGVAHDANGRLEAHAWLESEGRIVIGGANRARYVAMSALER
jgi:hypothetical protein